MKRVWLVGASEGIGRALAKELDANGFQCILSARNEVRLRDLAKELNEEAVVVPLDVSSLDSIQAAWKSIESMAQPVDMLIYCVGYYKPMSALSMDIEEVTRMVDTILMGAIRVLNILLPDFIKRRQGKIVLIGSISGYRGLPSAMGYGLSKAGLMHLAENLKCDLSGHAIEVQIINPGFVKTRLTQLNDFPMPFIMEPEVAAKHIYRQIQSNRFESYFPFLFGAFTKLMSRIPYGLYFSLVKKVIIKH